MTEITRDGIKKNLSVLKGSQVDKALALMRNARRIRAERVIRVCSYCHAWWDGEEWNESHIPVGKQTHGACPDCFKKAMDAIKADTVNARQGLKG